MCQLCTTPQAQLAHLTSLYCSSCPLLVSLPSTLTQLTSLNCFDCPLLVTIPSTLTQLTYLYCSSCPLLASIPSTLTQLTSLSCDSCPVLASLPSTLTRLASLYCNWWLAHPLNTRNTAAKHASLRKVQRYIHNRKARRFARLTSSRAFNESFFAPLGKGGVWHKRRMAASLGRAGTTQ